MADFDFDKWHKLAQNAPEEFERERQSALDSLIEKAENRRKLQGLQCRIDLERTKARTPLKSYLRLSVLMWDGFLNLRDVLNEPVSVSGKHAALLRKPGASVIPFRQ